MNNWSEKLVEKCPPDNAFDPDGLTFYRLAKSSPATEIDFHSQRKLNPTVRYTNVSECISRSLSIWDDIDKCLNILKLPRHKNKTPFVMQLNLVTGDGLVLQTFKPNHYSWWRTNNYDLASSLII
jgi:hypothetical protein